MIIDQPYGISTLFVADMGPVLAKLCAPSIVQPRQNARGKLRKLVSELADQQPATVIAACQAQGESVTTARWKFCVQSNAGLPCPPRRTLLWFLPLLQRPVH